MTRTLITCLIAAVAIIGVGCLLVWAMLQGVDE